jgi:hypothetical protein
VVDSKTKTTRKMKMRTMKMTETFKCTNCEELFNIDDENYSNELDNSYCDACCDAMEQDEHAAKVDHMMGVMEDRD